MARLESVALGGYYPTPARLVSLMARLVKAHPNPETDTHFMDPCAGEGSAVISLMREMVPEKQLGQSRLYTIELEEKRHKDLATNVATLSWHNDSLALHSDAFCVNFRGTVSVLFLNPPYDTDREYGRLEHRFLSRFSKSLCEGGALFFLVPFYALSASADLLATQYDKIECYRFPDPEWSDFKQVVLVARKSTGGLSVLNESLHARVIAWASNADTIPVLRDGMEALWTLPEGDRYGSAISEWTAQPLDVASLLEQVKPWSVTDRSGKMVTIPGIIPEANGDILARYYPTAMPPRPAHIAAGIAAGVFNGARVTPNNRASKLPALLVKGVFDKEFRTVEEKVNKQGATTGVVQVQEPKLVVTVLDLSEHSYHTLAMDAQSTGATRVANMSTGDLLQNYSRSLLDVLLAHCPVLHDPAKPEHKLALPFAIKGEGILDTSATQVIPRELFRAQAQCAMAAVKLLGGAKAKKRDRKGKAAIVLGEIGSGKSSVALAVAHSIKSRRVLVLCPPHLLQSWSDQIKAVTPWAKVTILQDVTDVETFASDKDTPFAIAILSRETAKLGHALQSVTSECPGCGSDLSSSGESIVKRRSVCEATQLSPTNDTAELLTEYARILMRRFPHDSRISHLMLQKHMRKQLGRLTRSLKLQEGEAREACDSKLKSHPRLLPFLRKLARMVGMSVTYGGHPTAEALALILAGMGDFELTAKVAKFLYMGSMFDLSSYGPGSELRNVARKLLLLMPVDHPAQKTGITDLMSMGISEAEPYAIYKSDKWVSFQDDIAKLRRNERVYGYGNLSVNGAGVFYEELPLGHMNHFLDAIGHLSKTATWKRSRPCGTHLYQSVPEPRRVPLASYITKRHPDLFDMLFLDESHEYSAENSAQSLAAHRLTSLGMPTLLLTGSVMNGYAESLFANLWAISPAFRSEFNRDDRNRFVDRYGYKKRFVEMRDKESGKPVEYGAVTDRIEEKSRDIGQAPGVMPLLILRHLLPLAVTLHKTDLALDLPKCIEIVEKVTPSTRQEQKHSGMLRDLLKQIKSDRFVKDRAGKLFGQLAEAPSQLDRATEDTGNATDGTGAYEVRYPESVGGELVARVEPLSMDTVLPKEQWVLDKVKSELSQNRNVMVFSWHVELLPRLARLIEMHLGKGEKVAILNPAKVTTAKREAWINKEVVGKNRRVMVTNPVAIRTGLNPLVYFATEIFHENPACDPITYRQAVGRVDRIGQTKETRIYFPVYNMPSQVGLHELLLLKVAVSMSTDGLDAEGALAAAGASEQTGFAGMSVGKHLYELLAEREQKTG